jgi:hypothetical protein
LYTLSPSKILMTKTKAISLSTFFGIYSILIFAFVPLTYPSECDLIRNGTFHSYQNKGLYHSKIIRKDSSQIEINVTTGDSTFWRIAWISDCAFTCTFISGANIKSTEEVAFYKSSNLKFYITHVSRDYYTYEALLTNRNYSKTLSDTIWLHQK